MPTTLVVHACVNSIRQIPNDALDWRVGMASCATNAWPCMWLPKSKKETSTHGSNARWMHATLICPRNNWLPYVVATVAVAAVLVWSKCCAKPICPNGSYGTQNGRHVLLLRATLVFSSQIAWKTKKCVVPCATPSKRFAVKRKNKMKVWNRWFEKGPYGPAQNAKCWRWKNLVSAMLLM